MKSNDVLKILDELKGRGATEVELYPNGKLKRVAFSDISPDDLKRLLSTGQEEEEAKLLDGLDKKTRLKVEKALKERLLYRSS